MKKFFAVIGNPPYQDDEQDPLYSYFYDAAEKISDRYILISPARFLFNAGLTSKEWNKKMLNDEHLKVLYFNQNSDEIFQNTDIKGGVAVMYRNSQKIFGAIKTFIPDEEKRKIAERFNKDEKKNFPSIMHGGRSDLKFNDAFLKRYPNTKELRLKAIQRKRPETRFLAPNEEYELKSSAFEVLAQSFYECKPKNEEAYYKIWGLSNSKRTHRWIEKEYMDLRCEEHNNIDSYKVFIPKAIGSGLFGEKISDCIVSAPGESATPTFISIGCYKTEVEAKNTVKYIKTKLVRALLGLLKITQDNVPGKWAYVPLQDFTSKSDIDWTKSVHEIDLQLYEKYDLSKEEKDFIETHVKEMV